MKKLIYFLSILSLVIISCTKEGEESTKTTFKQKSKLITLKSGATVEKRGERYFVGGDVALSDFQLKLLDETGSIFANPKLFTIPKDSIITGPSTGMKAYYKYPESPTQKALGVHPYLNVYWAMVRFTYGPNLSYNAKNLAIEAMRHIQERTNIRFYNATGKPTKDPTYGFDYPYIEIIDNLDNPFESWSYIGRLGGKQNLAIGAYANTGTVVHEFFHAAAMYHEHSRVDRDNFITVNYSNMKEGNKVRAQFEKITRNYYIIGNLDFNSIMIYDSYTYSKNGKPTLVKKSDGSTWIANRTSPSELDRMWINTFYLPYVARSDVYRELAEVVFKSDNTVMTPAERLELQARLNNGNPTPPANGRIPNEF